MLRDLLNGVDGYRELAPSCVQGVPLIRRHSQGEYSCGMTVVVSRWWSAALEGTVDGERTETAGVALIDPIRCLRPRSLSFEWTAISIVCYVVEYEGVRLTGRERVQHHPGQS